MISLRSIDLNMLVQLLTLKIPRFKDDQCPVGQHCLFPSEIVCAKRHIPSFSPKPDIVLNVIVYLYACCIWICSEIPDDHVMDACVCVIVCFLHVLWIFISGLVATFSSVENWSGVWINKYLFGKITIGEHCLLLWLIVL